MENAEPEDVDAATEVGAGPAPAAPKVKLEKKPDPRPELPLARRHVWAPENASMLTGSPGLVDGLLADVFHPIGDGKAPYYVVSNGYDSRERRRFDGVVSVWQLAKAFHGDVVRREKLQDAQRCLHVKLFGPHVPWRDFDELIGGGGRRTASS